MEALTLENSHVTLYLPYAVLEIPLPSRPDSLLPCCQIYEVTSEEEMKNGKSSIAAVLAMQGILSISFQLLQT